MKKTSEFDGMDYTKRRRSQRPKLHYDAIVIGSGYGGSVSAFRLSQAEPSLSVCVLEKGHSWQPHQFPTTFWQLMRTLTIHTPLGTIGSNKALLQVYLQPDCLSMLGVGVGGGSLVNGGIILPTPLRTRRDPRWPKEWEQNWHVAERRARAMLQPEAVPHAFPTTLVMDTILANHPTSIEDELGGLRKDDPLQISVTFSNKKNAAGVEQLGCKACGNCFHGCPYNAKSSTDKNYLAAAVQAGAEIRTECAVSFIARTPEQDNYVCDCSAEGCCSKHDRSEPERRWRVYLNEVDYLTADFVVLSAGVHGTMEILLRSKERGLQVSDLLGCGVSGNGNNLAFIGAPKAPTKGTSISKKDFTGTAMISRPGPSISNSYTSSLGFTIQTAIAPQNFPHMVYKCLASLPEGYGLLDRIWNDVKQLVPSLHDRSILVNVMGHDAADGVLQFDQRSERLKFTPPHDELIVKKVKAMQKLATRLQGLLYFSRFRSTSVHYLGGCSVGQDKSTGVTNASGQMFSTKDGDVVHDGLYVCDASLIPCSVGVNPCFTIATAAEHVSSCIVRDALQHNLHGQRYLPTGQAAYASLNGALSPEEEKLSLRPAISPNYGRSTVVIVRETLRGNLGGMPCSLELVLHMDAGADEDVGNSSVLRGQVGGKMFLNAVDGGVLYVLDGRVNMCCRQHPRTPFTQYMHYHLLLSGPSGKRYMLDGYKEMRPFLKGLLAWRESTTLNATLYEKQNKKSKVSGGHIDTSSSFSLPPLQGQLHLSLLELVRSALTLRGPHKLLFVKSLLQSIFQTYFVENPNLSSSTSKAAQCCQDSKAVISQKHPYPGHRRYDIQTGDGTPISMIQWPCNQSKSRGDAVNNERAEVVLLLNGYCTESFWLPTEESDLVRCLLRGGYEPWLLQNRAHPAHATPKHFTIDDIARFDLPAAFSKIYEVVGQGASIHVVAHCLGGLTIHMALLGGYLPSSYVTSILCTNSSMFFRTTRMTIAKLIPPLLAVSMAIAGDNRLLSMGHSNVDGWRHTLLRKVAQLLPRVERCNREDCEVFSGIFGNIFWHENLRPRVHEWMNNEVTTKLSLGALQHLRLVCLAGRVVDANGNDTYLQHPERLALPTTYISGGREILVTLDTSAMAQSFMQCHHPSFSHSRIVVPKYGHNDLLIGEHSERDVFPHILGHLERFSRTNTTSQQADHQHKINPWEAEGTLKRSNLNILSIMDRVTYLCCFMLIFAICFLAKYLFPKQSTTIVSFL